MLKVQQRAQETAQRQADQCSAENLSASGGNIIPPKKLIDVKPEYPDELKAAKIAGEVKLESVIAADGTVTDVRVLATRHDYLVDPRDGATIDFARLGEVVQAQPGPASAASASSASA